MQNLKTLVFQNIIFLFSFGLSSTVENVCLSENRNSNPFHDQREYIKQKIKIIMRLKYIAGKCTLSVIEAFLNRGRHIHPMGNIIMNVETNYNMCCLNNN